MVLMQILARGRFLLQERLGLIGESLSLSSERRRWWVTKFALGPKNYWPSYVADSSSALFFVAWEIGIRRSPLGDVALAGASGYMMWGFSEYAFHRWLYHQRHGILAEGHRVHHEDPVVLIAMPWFMTTATVLGLWYLCSVVLRLPLFSACVAGWLAGSLWYSLVHHSHHHWGIRNPWLRKLRAHHHIHHQCPEFNFGVTMRLWDIAFGTRYREQAYLPRVRGGSPP
jgi:sterol desaturase/sphingolipid hydroxylase (fatty acid hydroxylase superfamily)